MLRNESEQIVRDNDSIALIGVDNAGTGAFPDKSDLKGALKGISQSEYKILLSHDPSHWRREVLPESDIDLMLAGHTHAMQFKIFGWSPSEWVYPEWGGLYIENGRKLYVSTGISENIAFRFGSWPTIEIDDDRTYFLMTIPCREDMIGQNDIDTANHAEDSQQNNAQLEQILGQSFVKVQNLVYQSSIVNKQQLLQILEQLSVKVWNKSKKPIDKEVMSRLTIEMIEFLGNNPSTVKHLLEFLNYSNSPEFRRKILNPMQNAAVGLRSKCWR